METQGFSVSHILDITHYSTVQHQIHGYSGIIAGSTQGATVQQAGTLPLGYTTQAAQSTPYQAPISVTIHPSCQIQYYYEPAEPSPLPTHLNPTTPHLNPTPHHLQVRYASLQPVPASSLPSADVRIGVEESGVSLLHQEDTIKKIREGSPQLLVHGDTSENDATLEGINPSHQEDAAKKLIGGGVGHSDQNNTGSRNNKGGIGSLDQCNTRSEGAGAGIDPSSQDNTTGIKVISGDVDLTHQKNTTRKVRGGVVAHIPYQGNTRREGEEAGINLVNHENTTSKGEGHGIDTSNQDNTRDQDEEAGISPVQQENTITNKVLRGGISSNQGSSTTRRAVGGGIAFLNQANTTQKVDRGDINSHQGITTRNEIDGDGMIFPHQENTSREDSGSGISLSHQENAEARRGGITPSHQENTNKRKRMPGMCAKLDRKKCRNRGEAYVNAAGKLVPVKKYVELDCRCKNECLRKLGMKEDREGVFRRFWEMGDFGQQNVYLAQSVVLVPHCGVRRTATLPPQDERNLKTVQRIYYVRLKEGGARVRVCKSQFLRLHGVSNGRLDRVLQALHCRCPNALQDRRGHHTPSNKTSQKDVELVLQHLHHLQQRTAQTSLTSSDIHTAPQSTIETGRKEMSVKKMYELYRRWCEESGNLPVSLWVYRQIEKTGGCLETRKTGDCLVTEKTSPVKPIKDQNLETITENEVEMPSRKDEVENTAVSVDLQIKLTGDITTTTTTTITTATTTSKVTEEAAQGSEKQERRKMSREERKSKRNKGEAYVTSSGKMQSGKVYQDKACGCRYKCIPALGTLESRRRVFDGFWALGSFTRQNAYIAQTVALVPLSQHSKASDGLSRTYMRMYNVRMEDGGDLVRVCKLAFLRLHGVSNGRMDRVLQAVACQSPFALKDRRGQHSPRNKTQEEDIVHAFSHMRTFPQENPSCPRGVCLPKDVNVEKMYRLYREQCAREGRKPVGSFVYRRLLKERFSCRLKSPADKTPEEDMQFASQFIDTCGGEDEEGGDGGGDGSSSEASIQRLHHDYSQRCLQEGRNPVTLEVFRKVCSSEVTVKPKP